jgi:hypothetical protein
MPGSGSSPSTTGSRRACARPTAALAVSASLVITAAYHLGFPEFRGPELIGPLIGNGVFAVYAKAKSLSSMVTTPFSRTLSPR